MSVSAEMERLLRRRMERMERISNTGIRLTAGLAAFNARMIFRTANGHLPADQRLPESALTEFAELLLGGLDAAEEPSGDGGGPGEGGG